MRILLLSTFLALQISAASFQTIRSGNWTDTSTATSPWCNSSGTCATALVGSGPGGVPGAGDKILFGSTSGTGGSHVLTCPAGAVCTVGADDGTLAMTRQGNVSTCGSLVIANTAEVVLRGHYADDCWTTNVIAPSITFQGASTLTFSSNTTKYFIGPVNNGGARVNGSFVVTGTSSTAKATIRSTGTQNGYITASTTTGTGYTGVSCTGCNLLTDGASGAARWVTIDHVGDATNAAIYFQASPSTSIFDLEDYTVIDSGAIFTDVTVSTAAIVRFKRGAHLYGKGTYDIDVALMQSYTGSGDATFEDLALMGGGLRMNGQYATINRVLMSGLNTNGNLGKWKAMTNCLLRKTYSGDQNIHGPINDLLVVSDNGQENQHIAATHPTGYGTAQMIDGLFLDSATKQNNGGGGADIGDGWLSASPASVQTYYINRMITSLTPEGNKAANNAFTLFSSSSNFRLYTRNNTGAGNPPTFMSVQENGGAPGMVANQVSMLNTIVDHGGFAVVSPAAKARITNARGGEPNDIFVPASTDYNAGYNLEDVESITTWTNRGKGYSMPFSFAPGTAGGAGTHDIDVLFSAWVGPRLADRTRSTVLFDSEFLGNSPAAWSVGSSYARGTYVSNAVAGWFAGKPVNYVCIAASGCPSGDATTEPGNGSAWRTYWMYASYMRAAEAIRNGVNSITSRFGTLTYIETMSKWFQFGFMPQNPVLWARGCQDDNFDGTCESTTYFVGAVDPAPLRRMTGAASAIQ